MKVRIPISSNDRNIIKQIRADLGLSQQEFAKKMSMKLRAYQYLEDGKTTSISETFYHKLKTYGFENNGYSLSLTRDKLLIVIEKNKISRALLAEKTGLDYAIVCDLLKNNNKVPDKPMLDLISNAVQDIITGYMNEKDKRKY